MKTAPPVPHWVDRDELEQEAALARLEAEATGFDPDIAERKARGRFVTRERRRVWREAPATDVFHDEDRVSADLGWLPQARKVAALSPPKQQTPGQRRKFLRNQLILIASFSGFTQRQLGDVFDLPHSRIFAILDEMKARTGHD